MYEKRKEPGTEDWLYGEIASCDLEKEWVEFETTHLMNFNYGRDMQKIIAFVLWRQYQAMERQTKALERQTKALEDMEYTLRIHNENTSV